ncbi:MAG TPA: hypothetical protein VD884_15630 [Ohtaekwangia sp.]|nr:hypothetical protein [Ohtaekwangia sp.]
MAQTNTRFVHPQQEAVVIKLWEIYLLYHPANLYKTLTDKSVDHGPRPDERLSGRIIFRFATETWENDIKHLLYEYRIPVSIQSNSLTGARVKGRAPVLR